MQLSLDEVVVLSSVSDRSKAQASERASELYQSTKFDAAVALSMLRELELRKLIEIEGEKMYLTRHGRKALQESIDTLDRVRTAASSAGFST